MLTVKTQPDGVDLPLDALEQIFDYSGDFISTITVEYPPGSGKTYVQTFTNDGVNITGISGWELQP